MEEAAVLWVGLGLVIDELDLDGFHGTHYQDGLRNACSQTTEQRPALGQVALLVSHVVLQILKDRKPES